MGTRGSRDLLLTATGRIHLCGGQSSSRSKGTKVWENVLFQFGCWFRSSLVWICGSEAADVERETQLQKARDLYETAKWNQVPIMHYFSWMVMLIFQLNEGGGAYNSIIGLHQVRRLKSNPSTTSLELFRFHVCPLEQSSWSIQAKDVCHFTSGWKHLWSWTSQSQSRNQKRSTWTHFQRNIGTFVDFVKNVQSSSQTETVFPQFKSPVRLKKLQISASTSRVEHLNVLSGPSVKVLNYPGDISLIQEASSGLNFRMFLVDICPQKPSTLQWKTRTY